MQFLAFLSNRYLQMDVWVKGVRFITVHNLTRGSEKGRLEGGVKRGGICKFCSHKYVSPSAMNIRMFSFQRFLPSEPHTLKWGRGDQGGKERGKRKKLFRGNSTPI